MSCQSSAGTHSELQLACAIVFPAVSRCGGRTIDSRHGHVVDGRRRHRETRRLAAGSAGCLRTVGSEKVFTQASRLCPQKCSQYLKSSSAGQCEPPNGGCSGSRETPPRRPIRPVRRLQTLMALKAVSAPTALCSFVTAAPACPHASRSSFFWWGIRCAGTCLSWVSFPCPSSLFHGSSDFFHRNSVPMARAARFRLRGQHAGADAHANG